MAAGSSGDATVHTPRMRYLPQLDGVRAAAVVAVMAAHARLPFAPGGGIGVDVFFVLSGYLITALLLDELATTGTIGFRSFYVRRVRRLYPALLAVSAFSAVAFSIVRPFGTDATLLGILAAVLYASCWLRAFDVSGLGWFGHTWSLSVEEYFYAVWPPVLRWASGDGLGRLRRRVFALLACAVAYRMGWALAGVGGARIDGPDMRAEQLLAGCALAVLLAGTDTGEDRRPARAWTLAVILALADLARTVVFPHTLWTASVRSPALETVALDSTIVIAHLVTYRDSFLSRVLSGRTLVWVGRRSYAIYLWHLPLFGLLAFKDEATAVRVAGRVGATVLTLVAAWASFKWVETPFYRRRVADPDARAEDRWTFRR